MNHEQNEIQEYSNKRAILVLILGITTGILACYITLMMFINNLELTHNFMVSIILIGLFWLTILLLAKFLTGLIFHESRH